MTLPSLLAKLAIQCMHKINIFLLPIIQLFWGIVCGRALNGELNSQLSQNNTVFNQWRALCTKISEVNFSAFI